MRFMLSIYRVLLVIVVGLGLVGICFALFAAVDPAGVDGEDASAPITLIAIFTFVILNAGIVSILLAIHDRIDEFVSSIVGRLAPIQAAAEQDVAAPQGSSQ